MTPGSETRNEAAQGASPSAPFFCQVQVDAAHTGLASQLRNSVFKEPPIIYHGLPANLTLAVERSHLYYMTQYKLPFSLKGDPISFFPSYFPYKHP